MNEEMKIKIAKALSERIDSLSCPICHQSKYTLLDGYIVNPLQSRIDNMQLGGRLIPSIMLVCNNCGHLDKFSLGVLGLMKDKRNEVEGDKQEESSSVSGNE